jgi:hypothetical protein
MLRRSTLIVLGIFALLILGIFAWQRYGQTEEPVEATATVEITAMVFDLGIQTISSYSISGEDGTAIVFERDQGNNAWFVKDQPAELADVAQIEAGASTLNFLTVSAQLTTRPPLEAMGLDQPTYLVTLFLNDGKEVLLNVGDETPTGTGYYVQVDNNPAVVVSKAELDTVINLLKTPPLASTYTPTITTTMIATSTPRPTLTVTITPEATVEPEVTATQTP